MNDVRSEYWVAGSLMDFLNSVWLRINKMSCDWNRDTVESVRNAGFVIRSLKSFKIYSPAAPAAFLADLTLFAGARGFGAVTY